MVQVGPLRGDAERSSGWRPHHQDPLRPESRIDVVHVPPASDEQTGADEQNDRQRKLRHHEGAADSTAGCSARDTSATLLAGWTQVAAQRRNRRRQSHQDSRQKRDGQGPAEDAEIEAHFIQTRQVVRAEGTDQANAARGEQCANQSRDGGEQDAFGEQLPHDPSGARSKRGANGHLARASVLRASERLVTLAAAMRNTQTRRRRASTMPIAIGVRPRRGSMGRRDAPVPFGRRQLIVEAAGDGAHLRLGLVERHGRPKSSDDEPRLSAAHAAAGRVLPTRLPRPRDLETSGRMPMIWEGSR